MSKPMQIDSIDFDDFSSKDYTLAFNVAQTVYEGFNANPGKYDNMSDYFDNEMQNVAHVLDISPRAAMGAWALAREDMAYTEWYIGKGGFDGAANPFHDYGIEPEKLDHGLSREEANDIRVSDADTFKKQFLDQYSLDDYEFAQILESDLVKHSRASYDKSMPWLKSDAQKSVEYANRGPSVAAIKTVSNKYSVSVSEVFEARDLLHNFDLYSEKYRYDYQGNPFPENTFRDDIPSKLTTTAPVMRLENFKSDHFSDYSLQDFNYANEIYTKVTNIEKNEGLDVIDASAKVAAQYDLSADVVHDAYTLAADFYDYSKMYQDYYGIYPMPRDTFDDKSSKFMERQMNRLYADPKEPKPAKNLYLNRVDEKDVIQTKNPAIKQLVFVPETPVQGQTQGTSLRVMLFADKVFQSKTKAGVPVHGKVNVNLGGPDTAMTGSFKNAQGKWQSCDLTAKDVAQMYNASVVSMKDKTQQMIDLMSKDVAQMQTSSSGPEFE